MSGKRKAGQRIDAFSLPTSLYNAAVIAAARLNTSRSGFYRYCLAKECGYSEEDARAFLQHGAERNAAEKVRAAAEGLGGRRVEVSEVEVRIEEAPVRYQISRGPSSKAKTALGTLAAAGAAKAKTAFPTPKPKPPVDEPSGEKP